MNTTHRILPVLLALLFACGGADDSPPPVPHATTQAGSNRAGPKSAEQSAAKPAAAAQQSEPKAKAPEDKRTQSWSFDADAPGALPPNWVAAETTSAGTPGTWAVVARADAHDGGRVLALTSTANAGQTFNLAVAERFWARDVSLTVHVRAVSGAEDQGGGPVWRYVDADNYYVCRFNPLEDNFRVYKVIDGVRTELASADVPTEVGKWYRVRVSMIGSKLICLLGDQKLLEVSDESIPGNGKVGCWTKADALTEFDTLSATRF